MAIENNELKLIWSCKPFSELSASELYNILEVRSEVFVVEQNCVYQDLDNKDLTCWHLAGYHENVLVAYARLVPPGLSYKRKPARRSVSSVSATASANGIRRTSARRSGIFTTVA